MAAVTHLGNLTPSTADVSSYATGSLVAAVNDLLVVIVATSDSVAATTTMVESAGGGTYTQIARATKRTSLDSLYMFVRNTLCETAVGRTFTWATADAATGCHIAVAKATGMGKAGMAAVRQFKATDNGAVAGTPNTVFPAVALTGNACICAVTNGANPATMTPPASFTERADLGYITPTTGLEYASRDSGHTSATITWASTSASAWGALSIELDTMVLTATPIVVMRPRNTT